MRQIARRLGAVGVSPWIFLDHRKESFQAALAFVPSSGATLTGKIQHTFGHPHVKVSTRITRSTTVATLLKTAHGLSVGDYLVVEGAGAPLDGEFSVASVVDANNVTYTVANSGATVSGPLAIVGTARVFDHENMTAMTTATDGNYAFPPAACRLNLTAWTVGTADLLVVQAG